MERIASCIHPPSPLETRYKKSSVMNYYILNSNDQRIGPFSPEELRARGITAKTLVKAEGQTEWSAAEDVSELKPMFAVNTSYASIASPHDESGSISAEPEPSFGQATEQTREPEEQTIKKPKFHITKGIIAAAVCVGVILLLIFTNPSKDKHREKVISAVSEYFTDKDDLNMGLMETVSNTFALEVASIFIDHAMNYNNYLVCSTTSVTFSGKTSITSFGILGMVFTLDNKSDKKKSEEIEEVINSSDSIDESSE